MSLYPYSAAHYRQTGGDLKYTRRDEFRKEKLRHANQPHRGPAPDDRGPRLGPTDTFGVGVQGALAALEHLGYVQIDTISVIERAHHHVFWNRVSDFKPADLSRLVEDRKVFEYWSHAASFLPMRDYRFSLPRKKLWRTRESSYFPPTAENRKLKKQIIAKIRGDGPQLARNFESSEKGAKSGWWDWKPAKRALEQLFSEGHLMVSARRGFDKVYDLTERVLPVDTDCRMPTVTEMAQHLILNGLKAHGLMRAEEFVHLRPALREAVTKQSRELLRQGVLEELKVEGIEPTYLAISGIWRELLKRKTNPKMRILSPFDNHVIRRQRLRDLFDFDYTIECYLPQAKRQYGYFSLPLLKNGAFVGRLDAKADRPKQTLIVREFHCETDGKKSRRELWDQSQEALKEFALFNGCREVESPNRL